MKTSFLYKSIPYGDIFYVNNKGEEFLITEAVSPVGDGTYDFCVAFKVISHDDIPQYENPVYFCGISFLADYLKGDSEEFLNCCKAYLDSKEPDSVKSEVFYTGGGIWCGITQLEDGVFMGELNSWGGIWKTEEEAIESYIESDGFVREVNDKAELKAIWEKIYADVINSGDDPENIIRDCYLPDLDKDVEEF